MSATPETLRDDGASRHGERTIAHLVADVLRTSGVETVFSLVGTSNFEITQALSAGGAEIHCARHEVGAVCMATAWARLTRRVGICTIAKGGGVSHAMSGLIEAHKSHTPLVVIAGDTPSRAVFSAPGVAQAPMVSAVGIAVEHLHEPATAADDVARALHRAETELRPVVLMANTAVQRQPADGHPQTPRRFSPARLPHPDPQAIEQVAAMLAGSERPVLLAGRGAVLADARDEIIALADRVGGLLATTLLANGLFAGEPYSIGLSGGYANQFAAELLGGADCVISFGASLNAWTTRAGHMYGDAEIVQIDTDHTALSRMQPVSVAIHADAKAAATALLAATESRPGTRPHGLAERIASRQWRDQDAPDVTIEDRMDPRLFTLALEEILPRDRTIVTDGGGFMSNAAHLDPTDADGWMFAHTYVAIGTGLASAVGAAIARPDRLTVSCLGDAGTIMALPDLESAVRLGTPVLFVVYNDSAHGGELGHYASMGKDTHLIEFPEFDFAAVARAMGADAITARCPEDLAPLAAWLERRDRPMVLDAKVVPRPGGDELFETHDQWVLDLVVSQGF